MDGNIAHKAICLKLNKNWQIVQIALVSDVICDLMNGVVMALDIGYSTNDDGSINYDKVNYINPCDWETWKQLKPLEHHLSIRSVKLTIRVPIVVITKKYAKLHLKKFHGKPTREALAIRDNLIDGYSGLEEPYDRLSIDHIVPRSRGGADTYANTVLTTKETNNKKGNKLNHEVGLKLHVTPHDPTPIPLSKTIRRCRHHEWSHFLPKH